jgi:hypothetical protein
MRKNKPRRVFVAAEMPVRIPLGPTILIWLLLDRFRPSGWVWGAGGLMVVIMWVIWGIDAATRQNVSIDDLLRKNDDSNEG